MKKNITAILILAFQSFVIGQSNEITLSSNQMVRDLNILQTCWENIHPGIYRYNTKEEIKLKFDKLRSACAKPLNEKEFYLILSKLSESVKCGHTFLNPLNLEKEIQERILPKQTVPFLFKIIEGKRMIITHDLTSNSLLGIGDEVISINGVKITRIIDSLITVSRTDGRNGMNKKLNNINITEDEIGNYNLFDIYFPLFFRSTLNTYLTEVKKYGNTKTQNVNLSSITIKDRKTLYEKKYCKVADGINSLSYSAINKETSYMKFGTFAFWNSNFDPKKYVDSIFADLLSKKNIKNLIIDIRNNEGGDNTGDYITSYLIKTKIGCDNPDHRCYRYLAITDSLKKHLDTWDNSFKKPKKADDFFINELGLYELKQKTGDCDFIDPQKTTFNGKVYLLINAKNSSAGYEMARNFKTYKLGTLVGEATGGCQQGINGGEFFFLTLPNSKFEIDLPLIYNYHPNKPDQGISPDKEVITLQKDIIAKKDPQLEAVIKMIEKN